MGHGAMPCDLREARYWSSRFLLLSVRGCLCVANADVDGRHATSGGVRGRGNELNVERGLDPLLAAHQLAGLEGAGRAVHAAAVARAVVREGDVQRALRPGQVLR